MLQAYECHTQQDIVLIKLSNIIVYPAVWKSSNCKHQAYV